MSSFSKAFLYQPLFPISFPWNHQYLEILYPLRATLSSSQDDEPKQQKYLRIQSRTIGEGKRKVDFQTAIVTMIKNVPETNHTYFIDLHSQCHFGDKAYFEFFNDQRRFTDTYDRVHFELLISDTLLSSHPYEEESLIIPSPKIISPSPQDSHTAKQYNLYCQLDVMNYSQPNWVHCDYTREELLSLVSGGDESKTSTFSHQPIWALASTQSSMPALEFISAFTRPLTPSTPLSSSYNRRLFSNLFISGDALISCVRFLLWFLIPSPEVSVVLLDWSSLFPRPSGSVSRIINPVLTSLFSGDFNAARKLVFAQMLTSGQASSTRNENDWVVKRRNQNAVEKICTSMERYKHKKHAILYGALHGQDLQKRLENIGFHVQKIDWRTAWSVTVPEYGTGKRIEEGKNRMRDDNQKISWGNFATPKNSGDLSLALVVLPLYLITGGLDWLDTVQTVKNTVDSEDLVSCFVTLSLYLVRHVALYLSISKFVIDWDGEVNNNLFEADERAS